MRKQFRTTAVHRGMVQMMLLTAGSVAMAQDSKPTNLDTVVVTGQRAALQSAQKIKQNAEEIVDSVVAEEAGKLPDKSITEVLQRVVGITIDRNKSRGDPEHFSVEGSGISVRGLSWGSSLLNGRETFSAGWPGRELSWGDVPPELMAGVDVYKNPSSELIEGGVSGTVNLRTALPFDFKGTKSYISLGNNYTQRSDKHSPSVSGLYATQWNTDYGRFGALVDLSYNHSSFKNESIQLDAYYPRTDLVAGKVAWAPKAASYRTNTGDNERAGFYGALQWKKDRLESSLTYFVSGARETGSEQGIYAALENPYNSVIKNPVYDDRNVLQSGIYTYPTGGKGANNFADGGLGFAAPRGWSRSTSQTGELAWNFKWAINDRWQVQNDLQWVHSKNDRFSGSMQLGTFVPSMSIDVSGTDPVRLGFDEKARAHLADPKNYYWNIIMPMMSKADGDLYAWKADVRYRFEHPVLRDARFGVRISDRSATREQGKAADEWQSIAEPWNVRQTSTPGQLPSATDPEGWQNRGSFAYMNDPRYTTLPVEVYDYGKFYNGKVGTLPNIVLPTLGVVKDHPGAYKTLYNEYRYQQCLDGAKLYNLAPATTCVPSAYNTFKEGVFDGDPSKTGSHSERTQSLYGTLRFGFDDWKYPLEGNVGVRVVQTHVVAHGYELFTPSYGATTPPHLPRFDALAAPINIEHKFVDVLPSMNLKLNLTDKLQARFAMAKSMNRPGFDQLREYVKLNQNYDSANGTVTYTGENQGNAKLKPVRANSFDLALEWYPRDGQSLTTTAFYKDVKDIVMTSAYTRTYNSAAGNPQSFVIRGPDNVGFGTVQGLEIAGMTYLDRVPFLANVLPDWAKGLGVSANYTYIDGRQRLYKDYNLKYCGAGEGSAALLTYGCDTNGVPFRDLPFLYMAKNAANFVVMYDRGPLSMRLAYNRIGRILQAVNANGTRGSNATSADPARPGARDVGWSLPTWQEGFGQLDGSVSYKVSDRLGVTLNVTNLTDVIVRQTQQQHIGDMGRAWFYPGRTYKLGARYEF